MNFLDMLRKNPHGWGAPPDERPDGSIGLIQKALGQAQDNIGADNAWNAQGTSWLDAARNSAHYWGPLGEGENLNLHMPPALSDAKDLIYGLGQEAGHSIMAPGKALWDGITPEEAQHTAAVAAGLAMPGGFAARSAEAPLNALAEGARDYGQAAYDLFSNGSREGGAAGVLEALANTESKPGIIAYHGSPHDFDRFDMSKIGTGEGAQAYGHGLYFAESEGVAKSYKERLKRGPAFDNNNPQAVADATVHQFKGAKNPGQLAIDDLEELLPHMNEEEAASATAAIEIIKRGGANINYAPPERVGHMYQVRINADPNDFLDWDKPLSQQPANVISRMKNAGLLKSNPSPIMDNVNKAYQIAADSGRFSELFEGGSTSDHAGFGPKMQTALRESGIPGIRYLDRNSRAAGEGTANYVVFDDSIIDILKKYGILPAAYGGNALMGGEDTPTR